MKIRSNDVNSLKLAAEMIDVGARPKVIESTTGASEKAIKKLFIEKTGKHATGGIFPSSEIFYIRPINNNLQASLFYGIFSALLQEEGSKQYALGNIIVTAYKQYLDYLGDSKPVLDFNRAWLLTRLVKASELHVSLCKRCTSQFVSDPASIVQSECPACHILAGYHCEDCGCRHDSETAQKKKCVSCHEVSIKRSRANQTHHLDGYFNIAAGA